MPFADIKIRRPLSQAQIELRDKMLAEVSSDKYRAVSFKLMGTLTVMPFSGENDIFTIMEKDIADIPHDEKTSFTDMRCRAAEAALKKYATPARVTLAKIYSILAKMNSISKEDADRLMARECELVEKYAVPRECSKLLFRKAKNCKKRVIVTAETIYPYETVKNILENCGYGSYDELVMVSDIPNCTSESYYDAVLKKAGVSADKLLHIGSDVAFDVELPIIKGSKALLMASPDVLMAKSGRVRGYAEEKDLFNFDGISYLKLRLVFGLYSLYAFDAPQNKNALSDFCCDEYMMGFIILGSLALAEPQPKLSKMQETLIEAMQQNEKMTAGRDDLLDMFSVYFADIRDIAGCEGCQLPLDFAEKCCPANDRKFLEPYLSADTMKKWSRSVKEPEIVPVARNRHQQNALSRLADKMFPPNTKVRNIVDGILAKGHKHSD